MSVSDPASGGSEGGAFAPSISGNGRFVAFRSNASNLVAGDTNGVGDVFVRDLQSGATERASVSSNEAQGNRRSDEVVISADGRYVAFASRATNLVAHDTNRTGDVFMRDRTTGTTTRVSVRSDEKQSNDGAGDLAISRHGALVAFTSGATNLVPGDTNGSPDVFVRNRVSGLTRRVTISNREAQSRSGGHVDDLSENGRFVVFSSGASNLVRGDTNRNFDVFVRDRWNGTTRRVSVSSSEGQGNDFSGEYATISYDGRYVAFDSYASNLVAGDSNGDGDAFVRDMVAGTTRRVSVSSTGQEGNGGSHEPAISGDGHFVAFTSNASTLTSDHDNWWFDVFVRDLQGETTSQVSVSSAGVLGNFHSAASAISGRGAHVVFESRASNLAAEDTEGRPDVFLRATAP